MICQAIAHLDKLHAAFKSKNLDLEVIYPLLLNFQESAFNHAENIQPDDPVSSDLKALYLSEKDVWGYLLNLFDSSQAFHRFWDQKKTDKFSFFSIFNPKVAQAFQNKDLSVLDSMRVENAYLSHDFSSELSVINDILNFDEILWTLYSLVDSLPLGSEYNFQREVNYGEVTDYKEVCRLAEWDFMGAKDPKACEAFTKADNVLFQEVFGQLRKGRVDLAQDVLLGQNRYVFAANLNSGLAYHDFSQMDKEIMEERERKDAIQEEHGILGSFHSNRRGILVETAKEFVPKVLDFMRCRDFNEAMDERKTFYLSLNPNDDQSPYCYQGSCGNRNWLFSLTNFFALSKQSTNKFEKAIYGFMASNPQALLPLCTSFRSTLWGYLRCFLNQEVVRRFIAIIYLFKENLLSFCMFDEDFFSFDREDPFQIYEKVIHKSEEVYSMFGDIEQVLKGLGTEEEIGKHYHRVQYLLIRGKLLSKHYGSQTYWNEVLLHLLDLSKEDSLNKVEFATYFVLSLRMLGFYDSQSPEILKLIDEILLRFVHFIRRIPLNPAESLHIFNYLNNDDTKIRETSQYLLTLDPSKVDFAEIKQTLIELMGDKQAVVIMERLFSSPKEQETAIGDQDNDKIQALSWCYADRSHLEQAVRITIKLVREFIIEGKHQFASKVFREYLEPFLAKEVRQNKSLENLIRGEGMGFEIEVFGLFFIAEEAFERFMKEKNPVFWQDAAGKLRNLLIRNSIKNERFSIINLRDPDFLKILDQDKTRKDEVFAVKEVLLTTALECILKLHESQRTCYESREILEILTDEGSETHLFLSREGYRSFLARFTNLLLKSNDFIGVWLQRTAVVDFPEKLFS